MSRWSVKAALIVVIVAVTAVEGAPDDDEESGKRDSMQEGKSRSKRHITTVQQLR